MAAGQLYFNPTSSGMGTSDAYPICIPNPCASPSPQASPSPSPGACDVYSVEASNQPSCPGTLMSITTISDCAFARSVAITSWPGPAPTGGAMVSENSMTAPSGCYYSTTGQVRFNSNTAGTGTTTTHPICIDNPCPAASPSPGACGQFSLEAPNLPLVPWRHGANHEYQRMRGRAERIACNFLVGLSSNGCNNDRPDGSKWLLLHNEWHGRVQPERDWHGNVQCIPDLHQ